MAAAHSVLGLQEEAMCPICLEYYTDPVTTKCGHNFCRSCISACPSGAAGEALLCPQCREMCPQGEFRANRQLQNMVELVRNLSVQQERPPGEEGLCEEHGERLKLFCEEGEELICVVCRESSEHEKHKVRPVKEAEQRYKQELQDCLKPLREQLGAVQQCKLKEEEGCMLLRSKLEAERGKVKSEVKQLHQTLKEQEETLLRRLQEMEKKIITVENEQVAKLSAEMASLRALITEMERKCEQPAGELLKDIRQTLKRCEHVMHGPTPELRGPTRAQQGPTPAKRDPTPAQRGLTPEQRGPTPELWGPSPELQDPTPELRDPKPEQMKRRYKVLVTLDADSAHRHLALSEGGRRVTWTRTVQHPSANPQRFTGLICVLGREGYTSGRRYWEVQLLREHYWAVGVALESVCRGDGDTHTPERGVWAVQGYKGQYEALTSPPAPLFPWKSPRKLGFYLDYEGGRLSVYNADTLEELHTFTGTPFVGGVCPYLRLWGGTDLHLV